MPKRIHFTAIILIETTDDASKGAKLPSLLSERDDRLCPHEPQLITMKF